MAIDGSFSLESALERFLTRCPKLGTRFDSLARKGKNLKEEEVVSKVAELFLHPHYTIPLVGCFRPVARKFVDKAVSLLSLVPNLRLNLDKRALELGLFTGIDDVDDIIEFHVKSGRGLNLHLLACLAFCRLLDLAPFLLGSVLTYFKFAPPPFELILTRGTVCELSMTVLQPYLNAARISYRLLLFEPDVFSKLWDWSCFLDLIEKFGNFRTYDDTGLKKEDIMDVRWCGIQILSVTLRMGDRAISNFGVKDEEALLCLLRWEEFCQDTALEKAGSYIESPDSMKLNSGAKDLSFNQENCLQCFGLNSVALSQLQEIRPSTRRRKVVTRDAKSDQNPFVLTSSVKRSFEVVLLAVSQKWPVLLYGVAGCGKSALISNLAQESGNQVLSIHMDDQIDSKTLIGSYVCTEQPGEFRWQPGSLTQAIQSGYWIVFEDIDKAPSDVQSILLPLLEGRSSYVTGHGEEIRVVESFRLFSTISTSKYDVSGGIEGANVISTLWRRVMIGPPSDDDMKNIVKSWYPSLEFLTERFIETYVSINSYPPYQLGGFQSRNSASNSSGSRFSLRDLLKWCKRIVELDFSANGNGLSAYVCQYIYREAVDVFASFSASAEKRLAMMKELASLWAIPEYVSETLYPSDEPTVQISPLELRIGRVTLQRPESVARLPEQSRQFVNIRSSLHLLERIACSIKYNEPVLLVGETGTGKTTVVQNLALMLGQRLTVLNLSQQSDVADLLGGFKPMDARFICTPLYKEFEYLFSKTFSVTENHQIFSRLQKILMNKDWKKLLKGLRKYVDEYQKKVKKRKKPLDEDWENFAAKLETASRQIASSGMIFSFVEGAFITALRKGEWILLDEVNLSPPETLQRVIGVLEGESGSLCLAERGDVSYINRHPNFRIFACMNPATDAGKRDLPYSLRSRFTEFFVDDVLDDKDLDLFIERFLGESRSNRELIEKIRTFYKAAKKESEERLQDGANQKPQYSLRSLYRALEFTRKAEKKFGFQKALFDGFCMFFLTLLDGSSAKIMLQMIDYLLGKKIPLPVPFDAYLIVNRETSMSNSFLKNYVLTKSVKEHLSNLARAIFVKRYPILLQGPTSSGKTSLVQYLAAITGHEFVRINNHEHTDLQEYLGSYITDACGKLVFHEGVLVKAVRNGNWIVLDELNLAPSDVLEALNRLLDDNRELFVPELCETIKAHPDFMLFATQNPPTFYGGRKMLSRAFRNRFVEIHVDEIPENELSTIIEKRCEIPESYAKKMVEVMKQLQLYRQSSKVFAGKHGFITPRDLFRWANRFKAFGKSYEDLARDGYYILAERLRDEGEKVIVQEVLEKQLRVKIVKDDLYMQEHAGRDSFLTSCSHLAASERLGNIVWTKSMWRLYFLVKRCYELREPVLLVGETGGGKTTVCQVLSSLLGSNLRILNCHQYTETSDFIGGFCPVRDRSKLISEFSHLIERVRSLNSVIHYTGDSAISADIGQASSTLDKLGAIVKGYREGQVSCAIVTLQDIDMLEQLRLDLIQLHQRWQTIFNWQDGPLVEAMKDGSLFLVDEISLADDSVLERLNSVLEPERKLSLAEKGGPVMEKVTAHENFLVLATMNPGGDYGKKELSPALRNRFTEIWVPPVSDVDELRDIASNRIANRNSSFLVDPMLNFWDWFNHLQMGRMLTVRDLLSWVAFINATEKSLGPEYALLHGVFLMLLDGLSLGTGMSKADAQDLRNRCLTFLLEQLKVERSHVNDGNLSTMGSYGWGDVRTTPQFPCGDNMLCNNVFGINPFYVEKGHEMIEASGFEFLAPTTRRNALRVLRAMQLSKPVLLEGSPGVGKTSLVVALGKYSGHKVVRINLSEQTDMMDLLGSDLPIESDEGMKFAWSDGILLQAIKEGCWVLLDELNLAPQSVLEGLNAILDHRGEVFIPEIGLTFKCPSSFRLFACQNPTHQGGGRKGLPRSFLNRFTKVYVDELVDDDYLFICTSHYPSIPRQMLLNLILFNKRLHEETMVYHNFAQSGSPWEFNLRDVIRSCQMIQGAPEKLKEDCFLNILYVQRMRTAEDRREVLRLYEEIFGRKPFINPYPRVQLNSKYLVVGNTVVKRNYTESSEISTSQLKILPDIRLSLEAAAHCVKQEWLCILVGPSSSGKTSLIRLLAQLTGNVLNELNLSSATDISELLGCFEQYNAFRNFRSVVGQVERYVNEYCSLRLESSTGAISSRIKDLISRWLAFLSSVEFTSMTSYTYTENWKCIGNSLSLLVEIIEELRVHVEYTEELNRTMRIISKLQENQQKSYSAKFEWVTGSLIKALENGEWIVLENANLCNPTVLDRINSLVEPSGSITVNECGTVDGKPVIIQPHPNFRMFLTINPSHGEVSRAMRNRGVEIHVMPPYWLFDETNGFTFEDSEIKDVKRFLVLCGIPGNKVVESMAKVHLYAKAEGLRINRKITYFDLARWVQLFQQLLMNGNQPIWSLKVSWEHTYLSSLGEAEGGNPTFHVSNALLPLNELYESGSFLGNSLSMPGGWPMPLKIRDFVWYSKEACVRQNCMYLEFLGFQYASCELENSSNRSAFEQAVPATNLLNVKMLRRIMFPEVSKEIHLKTGVKLEFNSNLAKKMILFAANWVIEQATQSDFQLYRLRFQWLGSCLWSDLSHCPIFNLFLTSLEQELEEPIWQDIFRLHKELTSPHQVDLDSRPIPLLSMEFIDLSAENDMLKMQRRLNAINCVDLLRLNYQQWNAEREHGFSGELRFFKKFFDSLGSLEKGILKIIVGSPSFDELIQLYTNLLEDHMLFWDSVVSSKHESSLIAWRALIKDATKLFHFCPGEVEIVQRKGQKLGRLSSWQFDTERSLLWVHGGHPSVPRSAQLYDQQRQLLKFCQSVWQKQVNDRFIDVVASSNYELRSLALQGLCLSSHIAAGSDEDDTQVAQKLEEIYRMLGARFDHERHKLEANSESDEVGLNDTKLASCCNFCPEVLCKKPVFDSWLDTFPISDSTSWFLDMELLQELSQIHLGDETDSQLPQALGTTFDCMESALKYSLALSRRPPQTFVAHQKLLWMLDARMSVDAVKAKVASFVCDMWFWWHSFVWSYHPAALMSFSKTDRHDVTLPDLLFQPMKTATVFHILQSIFPIKDYSLYCLKLRVASCNLWQSCPPLRSLPSSLLSVARSLFCQMIYVHKKTFAGGDYAKIKLRLGSFEKNKVTEKDIHDLSKLIELSSHRRLSSLVDKFIKPLLRELYVHCSSSSGVLQSSLGIAWILMGKLRFHLLLNYDNLDPGMKYSWKCSQLEEKISSIQLDIKVREECNHLAGWLPSREADKKRTDSLQNLEAEHRRLQRKIVYRPDPLKFKSLKKDIDDYFLQHLEKEVVRSPEDLATKISKGMDLQQSVERVSNWQETASCFIDRLSDGYAEYLDIAQPVQVAVYEMKLGLSLVLSCAFQKLLLNRIGEENIETVMESIHSYMKYPRGAAFDSAVVNLESGQPEFSSQNSNSDSNICEVNLSLLEKLVTLSSNIDSGKGKLLHLKAAVHQNALSRVAHRVANARLMDKDSFEVLHKVFGEFANIWKEMKNEVKAKEDLHSQQFIFRPRAFTINRVFEVDKSTLRKLLANDGFSEWQELLYEEDTENVVVGNDGNESLEEEWGLMQEYILNNMVHLHNQLFGSSDLVLRPGMFRLSDGERVECFMDSYKLGVEMMQGLGGVLSSALDSKLVAEHLLRLCLEHEQKSFSSNSSAQRYNFYKDSNAPVMEKMVKLLTALENRLRSLLNDWEDNPGLQKMLDVTGMLLAIPLTTPLAKSLSGLQILLNKAQMLQETGSKFRISDLLEPITTLVCSWQKMEFESWPALLDEVQYQCESNALKLWFPLSLVLQRTHSTDTAEYDQSIVQSLEEFIHTSSIGEFGRRLVLLFAFLGQFLVGKVLGSYSSPWQEKNLKILYNVFGFYVQFLPEVMEHIGTSRKNIEKEVRDLLKLCRWERSMSVETLRRMRQKLRKLVQKYTDLLQQPAMFILTRGTGQKGVKLLSSEGLKATKENMDASFEMLNSVLDLVQFDDEVRSIWFSNWRNKVTGTLQNFHSRMTQEFSFLEGVAKGAKKLLASQSVDKRYLEEWEKLWQTLEQLCKATRDCGHLWEDEKRSAGKKRALSELLKLLETSGLQKHKFEAMSGDSNRLFLQPYYDSQHLLLVRNRLSHTAADVRVTSKSQSFDDVDTEWKSANEFYFKSLASLQLLQEICLKHHDDISSEQTNRSVSFLNHLIIIQQSQRETAYDMAKHLRRLRECASTLECLYSNCAEDVDKGVGNSCFFARSQHATVDFIWKQKKLFDSLNSMLLEESLLLRTIEKTHLHSCGSVKVTAHMVLGFIEKFIPEIRKAKESLDDYLLGAGEAITVLTHSSHDYVVSKHIEQLALQHFQVIYEFAESLSSFRGQISDGSSVTETLLYRIDDLLRKGISVAEEFKLKLETKNSSINRCEEIGYCNGDYSEPEARFGEALTRTYENIMNVLLKLGSLSNDQARSEDSLGSVTSWEYIFKSSAENLSLDKLRDQLLETISLAGKLENQSGEGNSGLFPRIGAHFKNLHVLVGLVLGFTDSFLQDFLAMHKTVSVLAYALANILASLFSKGFGIPAKGEEDEDNQDKSQDASGTGMGEGVGVKDVSDQITDEDQLLGTSEKEGDEQDASDEKPSKDEKGIEMEQNFDADTYSVSEEDSDGENGDEDGEEEQLESAVGETGENSEVIDEKLWDKEEEKDEENPSKEKEKYEPGSSVKDKNESSRELRAKEDAAAAMADEADELNSDGDDGEKEENVNQDDEIGDAENVDDMKMDKENAFADPTGLDLDEPKDTDEDTNMEENDDPDSKEEVDPDENKDLTENGPDSMEEVAPEDLDENEVGEDVNASTVDEAMRDAENEEADGTSEKDDKTQEAEEENGTDLVSRAGISEFNNDNQVPSSESATRPNSASQASYAQNVAQESNWSNSNEALNDLAPLENFPSGNTSQRDIMVAGSSTSGKLAKDKESLLPPQDVSIQKTEANPYRNIGDALEEWKERVKVSIDLPTDNTDAPSEIMDDDHADEYGYVSEFDKGTAQALGPATSEQLDKNAEGNKPDVDNLTTKKDDVTEMEIDDKATEQQTVEKSAKILRNKMEEQIQQIRDLEKAPMEEYHEAQRDGDLGSASESRVTVKKSYLSEDVHQLNRLSLTDEAPSKAILDEMPSDVKSNASFLWRQYELRTTRLSQELAEQLRLVMEPTLASKLQGDYKTGKRINMKKVIPYIASHYRKDKIWLRRTRPNKRDYQVVIAVDDSRSMSESCCGDVAIEALVTVCRAMAHLEMGNLSVVSFGKKGNIRSLHDFDQPFTGEAGVKMISGLTFKQENTIADEPVVDLLRHLNGMLDTAVANARLPSGQNPLQQLVLIIGDGRFHEKENLKQWVRNLLSKGRMVAFLLLDSSQESILDLQELSFQGTDIKVSKYLDSFPFPYYIVLRNIEALPRTLADLLRQWFEVMQNRRE